MKHFIIYKKQGEYASFPLIEKIESKWWISFFVAPKVDHFGRYDYKVYSTKDKYFQIWNVGNVDRHNFISNRELNDSIRTKEIRISIPGFKGNRFKQVIFIHKIGEKIHEIGLVGFKALFGFPRGIETDDYIFLPAYGILKNKMNIPFLIRYEKSTGFYKIIQMFNNPFVNLNEFAIINDDWRLIALFRQEGKIWMAKSFADIDGEVWTYPEQTHIIGTPPHLLRLNENEILCTYGYRLDSMGIRAVKIDNDCQIISKEVILRNDGGYYSELDKLWNRKKHREFHVGYPVSIKISDSEILTVYYITGKDHITHIAGTLWNLEEFLK